MSATAIQLDGVRVAAGTFVLGPLDLVIAAGEHVLLMGASGTGKSLLLETIIGVRPIHEGRILLRGVDVAGVPVHLRRCAWVPQSLGLFAHMSVSDNIAYARTPPFDVSSIADACGVAHLLDRRTPTLSRGEQSRVALARALAAEPDILLLDEPFAALDDESRKATAAVVESQHRARGFTLLHVTHDELATRQAFTGGLIRRLRLEGSAGSISLHG